MKKILKWMLPVLLSGICLSGCTIEVEEDLKNEEPVYYYYSLRQDETGLLADEYEPSEETYEVMVKELLQILGSKRSSSEGSNLLPEEVSINSFELQGNVLVLDFNAKYSKMSRSREALVRLGVVKTFLQIPEISAVRFTIEGKDLCNSKNEVIGEMTEDTFVEMSKENFDDYRYETFTLYFTDKDGKNLVEERRSVYYKQTLPKERVVLEQLAKGPMVKGNYPTISENTNILDITISDRVCYVDLSRGFMENEPEVSDEIAIYSVVNSLMAANDADKVQISVEGNSQAVFGEDFSLYSFYEMNESLVAEERN